MSGVVSLYDVLKARITGSVVRWSDAFTRADAATLGVGYTTVLGTMGIASNRANSQGSFENFATVDAGVGDDHYVQATYQDGDNAYLAVRMTGTGSVAHGYVLTVTPSLPLLQLLRWTNIDGPGEAAVLLGSATPAVTPGDIFALTVVGSALTVTMNGTSVITATDTNITTGEPALGGTALNGGVWDTLTTGAAPSVGTQLTGGLWYDAPPEDQTTLPYGTMTLTQVGDGAYSGDRDEVECEILLYHRPWSKNATLRVIADDVDAAMLRFASTAAGMLLVRSRSREPLVPASPEDRDLCGVRLTYLLAVWPAYLTQYA